MTHKARLTLCAAFLAYLAGDFFLFNGPLNRAVGQAFSPDTPQALEKARKEGVVARVGNRPISRSQLDRAVFERLALEGKTLDGLPPEEQTAAKKAALEELIESELLLAEMNAAGKPAEVPAAEIDERLGRLTARFGGDKGALDAAMKAQGIASEKDLRDRIASQIRIEKYVAAKVTPAPPTEEEAKKWFTAHEKDLALPERVEARHIFIPTVQTEPEEAKKKLEEALAQLNAKQKNFPNLAKEFSQDPSTKDEGGYLGWMSRARLSPDLAEPLFSLPVGQPTLVRSRLGWHLVEIMTRKGAEPRSFDDAKAEILSALETVKRRDAVKAHREKLRASATVPIRILEPEENSSPATAEAVK